MTNEQAKNRIEKLKAEINIHRYNYHVLDQETISPAALDSLKNELFILDENNPSSYLLSSIKSAKEDRKSGDFYSFKNNKEAVLFINDDWKELINFNNIKEGGLNIDELLTTL